MSDVAVVIASWSAERALALVQQLLLHEQRQRAHYFIVGVPRPGLETLTRLDVDGRLVEALDADGTIEFPVPPHELSPVEAMALGAERALADPTNGLLVFLHDDVTLDARTRGWDSMLLSHFAAHPRYGLAGFGGALAFAHPDIYKTPYDHRQLARFDFVSNMREAEAHGRRVTEAVRVAALDGFSMVMSREFYMKAGDRFVFRNPLLKNYDPDDPPPNVTLEASNEAWAACLRDGIQHHMADAWISCRARELGYETWMLPLAVHHAGGGTSVVMSDRYEEVCRRLGYTDAQQLYDLAHRRCYDRFARVIPFDVRSDVRGETTT